VDINTRIVWKCRISFDECGKLHSVVSGIGAMTVLVTHYFTIYYVHVAPTAGARIRLATAIGENTGLRPLRKTP
jgi:hypothetical protein